LVLSLKRISFMTAKWNSAVFEFSLIIEGTTEKVLQFIMPLASIYGRNFGFIWQNNVFLNTTKSLKQRKLYRLTLFLPRKKLSVDQISELPPVCLS
jgi:hypothetical protein